MSSSPVSSRSPALKRLMNELADLQKDPSSELTAQPLDDNLLEWHFTIRGPKEGGFAGGRYHGRLIFPPDYPFKPPNISFLTPNGRFEVGKKICLSITGHHPEYWRPAWGIRTALIAVISFMPTRGEGAIGALDYTEEERAVIAKASRNWSCSSCGVKVVDVLPDESIRPVEKLTAEADIMFTAPKQENAAGTTSTNNNSSNAPNESASNLAVQPTPTTTNTHTPTTIAKSDQSETNHQAPADSDVLLRQTQSSSSSTTAATKTISVAAPPPYSNSNTTNTAQQAQPQPLVAQTQQLAVENQQGVRRRTTPSTSSSPWWLDALIAAGVAVIIYLVGRKL